MRAPSRTIPELCEKRPGQPRFSKREKDLNWHFALQCPPAGAQFRNCAGAGRAAGGALPAGAAAGAARGPTFPARFHRASRRWRPGNALVASA